jgi:hypothetical protein
MPRASPSWILAASFIAFALPAGDAAALTREACSLLGCGASEEDSKGFVCCCPRDICWNCHKDKETCTPIPGSRKTGVRRVNPTPGGFASDPKRLYPIPGGLKSTPKGPMSVAPIGPHSRGLTPVTPIGPRSPVPSAIPRKR